MLTHTQRGDPASLTYMCHYTPKLTLHTFLLPSEVPTVCTDTHAHSHMHTHSHSQTPLYKDFLWKGLSILFPRDK